MQQDKPESIAYPADVCPRKAGTEVIFVARACAPGGRAVPSFDVRVARATNHARNTLLAGFTTA